MTLSELGAVLGIVVTASTVVGGAGKYYLDTEYVAESELEQQFLQKDIRDLKRDKRKLERLEPEMRSPQQNWEIQELDREIEELQDELNQMQG